MTKGLDLKVREDSTTVTTIGGDTVEVSPDGKKVVAYAKDGFELKTAAAQAKSGRVSMSDDFNTVVLSGVTIAQAEDGRLVISVPDGTVVVSKPEPANQNASAAAPKHGEVVKDGPNKGWVYLEFNQKALYVASKDSPGLSNHKESAVHAAQADAREPTDAEMAFILSEDVRDLPGLKGTFNTNTGSDAVWYRTSTPFPDWDGVVYYRRGAVGGRVWDDKACRGSLRLVRS